VSPEPTDAKLASDSIEISTAASQTLPKVQLDIDDAPFLQEKAPEAPPPSSLEIIDNADEPLAPPPLPDKDPDTGKKKKLIILCSALLLLLSAGGGGTLWWFVLRTPAPPPPKPQVVVVPSTPPDSGPADSLFPLAPFWLELTSEHPRGKDKIFFLVCKFTAIAKSEAALQEAQSKTVIIRDALYFYLKNKDYEFLTNHGNTQAIKNDLTSVINGYLTGGNKVDDVLFERYVTK
jgi:flagellar FliL protein